MSPQFFRYVGARGELELLPEGTVERELAEKGERLYQLGDLDELLAELAAQDERPPDDTDAVEIVGVEEVGALLIERALARENG